MTPLDEFQLGAWPAPGFGPAMSARLAAGDGKALLHALLCYVRHWMELGGASIRDRDAVTMTDSVGSLRPDLGAEQRALLAAGCDLLDLLSATPQGREAFGEFLRSMK